MVNCKSRHNQSQESVEWANQDIEYMLTTWMADSDNQTNKWNEDVQFVQFMKKHAYHPAMERSPYEATFGYPWKAGLSSIISQSDLHLVSYIWRRPFVN